MESSLPSGSMDMMEAAENKGFEQKAKQTAKFCLLLLGVVKDKAPRAKARFFEKYDYPCWAFFKQRRLLLEGREKLIKL